MPKLSRTRIINLNYNDGKRTIYNEMFDYGDGRDTLFSMENGIGKTVLIQFFMQPFIRNRRELAGRRFEDYYTSSSPTYIMHEILLDNGEKLLVGMVVKKDNSDDEKNKLRILTFLNKYAKSNDFDIINAPFVQDKRILNFSEAEDRIKKYKSGKVNFKYYNFNDSSKKSEYFEDLKSYKLDHKEWEDIIRSINNDESGLSNLYDKHKTDEALIRNVIIPIIESKINGEKNVIESIRSNLSKYIESFTQSKESLHEVELLKSFEGGMVPVTEVLRDGIVKEEERENLYRKLSAINLLCEEEFLTKSSEKLRYEDLMKELESELTGVFYEEYSLNYYRLQAEEEHKEQKLNKVKQDHENKELKHKELVKEKYIQECADIHEGILDTESKLYEVRERIVNYERQDSEIAQNIKNYRFTLKNIYDLELKKLVEEEQRLKDKETMIKSSLEDNDKQLRLNDAMQKKNIRAEADAQAGVRKFEEIESKFKKKYPDFRALRNVLLNKYDAKELEQYSLDIEESIKSKIVLHDKLTKEAAFLTTERGQISENTKAANSELSQKLLELGNKVRDLELFNKETAKILEILTIKNLPLNPATQREKLKEVIHSENIKLKDTLCVEQDKLREIEEDVHRYQTGLIQLPKEVLQSFENKGIEFQYALNWLQNYRGTKEEKESLIQNNPFFPYGIMLSAKNINILKEESLDVYTSIPIPIINRSDLNRVAVVHKNNDVLTIQNQEFLVSFNALLLDEEERSQLLSNLSLEIGLLKEEMIKLQDAINRNQGYERILADYSYNGDENEAIEGDIKKLNQVINGLQELLEKYDKEMRCNENRKDVISKELRNIENNQRELEEKRDKFSEFILEHQEFKKNKNELYNLQGIIEELKKKEEKLREENCQLRDSLGNLDREIYGLIQNIKSCSAKLELYKFAERGTLLRGEKNSIEAKLQACEKELGDDIKRDKEYEEGLNKDLKDKQNRLNRKIKEGNLSKEYMGVIYSEDRWEELRSGICAIAEELKDLSIQIHDLDKDVNIIATKKQHEVDNINKLGFDTPITKENIKDTNFRGREKKLKNDLGENEEIIKDYNVQMNKLSALKQRLEFYRSYSTDVTELNFNFEDLESAIRTIDEYIRKYHDLKKDIDIIESKLSKEIRIIHDKYRDKNRLIGERLLNYLNKENKISSHSDIESLLDVVGRKISTLELELKAIKSEEEVVINEILRYTGHVLQELRTIDKKSSIKHLGKTQKLLEISIPEDKEEESLREYIKERARYYADLEGDYLKHLESDIQSAELLSKLIGNINRIRVDIKKIEKTGLVKKSWKDVLSQNSGGEKFVSMFILLSSLMSYIRRREIDIETKEEKKILIMDNPFAKTNAEHLLEPMFQIAEKYNMQLLCFSGIGGSAVYNRFDKIYVAKVIEDRFRNKESVSFKAGNEETLELSDFTITKQQISMF